MTKRSEKARDVEPAGEVREAAEAGRRRPRTRVFSEAMVAAIPEEGEAVAAAPAGTPRRPPRWLSEAVVAAIPAEGGADDGAET
jgi:hypothetical protein